MTTRGIANLKVKFNKGLATQAASSLESLPQGTLEAEVLKSKKEVLDVTSLQERTLAAALSQAEQVRTLTIDKPSLLQDIEDKKAKISQDDSLI